MWQLACVVTPGQLCTAESHNGLCCLSELSLPSHLFTENMAPYDHVKKTLCNSMHNGKIKTRESFSFEGFFCTGNLLFLCLVLMRIHPNKILEYTHDSLLLV